MIDLITDRTQADVVFADNNRGSSENLKGAYNASDINRVNTAVSDLAYTLFYYGYGKLLSVKNTWTSIDNFSAADAEEYISNINKVIQSFFLLPSSPFPVTNIDELYADMGYERANDIERILIDIEILKDCMRVNFANSGQLYSNQARVDMAGTAIIIRLLYFITADNKRFVTADGKYFKVKG